MKTPKKESSRRTKKQPIRKPTYVGIGENATKDHKKETESKSEKTYLYVANKGVFGGLRES